MLPTSWQICVSIFISSGMFFRSAAVSLISWLTFTLTVMDTNRPPFFFCNLPHTDLSTFSGSWSVISEPSLVLICLSPPALTVCCFHITNRILFSDSFILFVAAVYDLSLLFLFITSSLCPFPLWGFGFWAGYLVSQTDVCCSRRAGHGVPCLLVRPFVLRCKAAACWGRISRKIVGM